MAGFLKNCCPGRALLCSVFALVTIVAAATTEPLVWELGHNTRVRLDEPVVVSVSEPGERRWGHHQFVNLSEYPGNRILLRYHAAEDAVKAYGTPSPTYISADAGKTWSPFQEEGLPPAGMSVRTPDGGFICMPMAKPLDTSASGILLPEPVSTSFSYENWAAFRVEDCPAAVQTYMKDYDAARWNSAANKWEATSVTMDIHNAMVWAPRQRPQASLLSRTAFERAPVVLGSQLLWADYRSTFIQDDGFVPRKRAITCLESNDGGKSWQRRATIAIDRNSSDSLTEPMMTRNVNGELVCVIRRADHGQHSMVITYSKDNGRTWEAPVALDQLGKFGVFPALATLDCGVMVLSYGRPGIFLSFSMDGSGRNWTAPFCMLPGNPKALLKHTDAYTCLYKIGPNKLLVAYSDFDYRDASGQQRKAIMVRELTIEKPE